MINKIVKNYKNNTIFGSILIIGIMILLIGFSYAFFVYNKTGLYTHTITGGKMSIIYDETSGNNITINNAYPLRDEEALTKGLEFEFTITGYNESEKNIYYAIEMDYEEDVTDKERFKDSDLKLSLYENDEELFKNEIFNNLDNQDIHYGMIKYGTSSESPVTNNYKLRIWINDYVIISDTLKDDYTTWTEADFMWFEENYVDVIYKMEADDFSSTLLSYYGVSIYTTSEFANSYANFKVNVKADLTYDAVGFITYDANGGEFTPEKTSLTTGRITAQKPVMENKGFLGWSSDKNATEPEYLSGDYYSGDGKVLYAVYSDTINVMDVFSDTILKYANANNLDYSYNKDIVTELDAPSSGSNIENLITQIKFINDLQKNIDIKYDNAIIKDDLTKDNQGSVKAWLEVEDESLSYILYIAAEGTIYLSNCVALFSPFVNCSYIDLINVDTSKVTDMSEMFFINPSNLQINSKNNRKYNNDFLATIIPQEIFLKIDNLSALNTENVRNMMGMFAMVTASKLDIEYFDTSNVENMSGMFIQCEYITELNIKKFNTSQVIDMSNMFSGCSNLLKLDLNNFNTSQVTNMSNMFYRCSNLLKLDLNNFNTSQVTNMLNMFYRCSNLLKLDLNNFDTSQVTNMSNMFYGCSNLLKLDLNNFNTSQVTDMSNMFSGCSNLLKLDLNNFNTSQVTNMSNMFSYCNNLSSLDLSNFDTSNVIDISYLIAGCNKMNMLNLKNFNTTNITNIDFAFLGCTKLNTLDLSNSTITIPFIHNKEYIKTILMKNAKIVNEGINLFSSMTSLENIYFENIRLENIIDMSYMFYNCKSIVELDLSCLDVSQVTDMSFMFSGCNNLSKLNMMNWNTVNVTNMSHMFNNCSSLEFFDVSDLDTINVTSMIEMFSGCSNLTKLIFRGLNTINLSSVRNMFLGCEKLIILDFSNSVMEKIFEFSGIINLENVILKNAEINGLLFSECSNLKNIDFTNVDTTGLNGMSNMFEGCSSLKELDLSDFNTSQVKSMMSMFTRCSSLKKLDLGNFDMSNVTKTSYMFYGCSNLETIICNNDWNTGKIIEFENMFKGCTSLVGAVSYNSSKIDITMANPTTGYFTYKQI